MAQSQPGGPPELYPRPRALPVLILMLGCREIRSAYVHKEYITILPVRAVVAESAGCVNLRGFYGLYALW